MLFGREMKWCFWFCKRIRFGSKVSVTAVYAYPCEQLCKYHSARPSEYIYQSVKFHRFRSIFSATKTEVQHTCSEIKVKPSVTDVDISHPWTRYLFRLKFNDWLSWRSWCTQQNCKHSSVLCTVYRQLLRIYFIEMWLYQTRDVRNAVNVV